MIKNRIMLKIIISVIVIVISIPSLSLYGTEDLHADTNIIQPSNDDTFISEGDPSKTWGSR